MVIIVIAELRCGERFDENVGCRTAQDRVHEKADLMRENKPCSPPPTASPRDCAYFVNRSVSNSVSLRGSRT